MEVQNSVSRRHDLVLISFNSYNACGYRRVPYYGHKKMQIGLFPHPKSRKFSHGNRKRKSLYSLI